MKAHRIRLEDGLSRLEADIEHAQDALIAREGAGQVVTHLGELIRSQRDFAYDLGQVQARIDDLELRL